MTFAWFLVGPTWKSLLVMSSPIAPEPARVIGQAQNGGSGGSPCCTIPASASPKETWHGRETRKPLKWEEVMGGCGRACVGGPP